MRIDSAGNVGIGTTSPLAKLDVYGDIVLSGSNHYLNFGSATGTIGYGLRDNSGTIEIKNNAGDWASIGGGTVASGTTGYIPYYAGYGSSLTATSSLYIASDGNVGIGTVNPGTDLDVVGGLYVRNTAGATAGSFYTDSSGGNRRYTMYDSSANPDIRFDTAGDSWITGGALGIGTSVPKSMLDITSAYPEITLYDTDSTMYYWSMLGNADSYNIYRTTMSGGSGYSMFKLDGLNLFGYMPRVSVGSSYYNLTPPGLMD